MAKISINLLPPELESVKKGKHQKSLVVQLSIGFLVVLVIVTIAVLSIKISQGVTLNELNRNVSALRNKLNSDTYRTKEGLVSVLKSRLDSINSAEKKDSPSSYAYSLMKGLLPEDMEIKGLKVDKKGKMTIGVDTRSTQSIETFINKLTDPSANGSKISQVNLDSLSRGKTDDIHMEINASLAAPDSKKTQAGAK